MRSPDTSNAQFATPVAGSDAVSASPVKNSSPVPTGPQTPPSASEADALARAQAGDHYAFAQLYSLHKRRIYSLCLRMVGNVAEAEDLTQEAFLQLHRKIATFRGDSAFSTWLHRLAINVVLMHLRKKRTFRDFSGRGNGADASDRPGSIRRRFPPRPRRL